MSGDVQQEGGSPVIEDAVEPKGRSTGRFDPVFRRNLMIIGGVLVLLMGGALVAALRFTGASAEKSSSAVSMQTPGGVQHAPDAKLSPEMQAALAEAQKRDLQRAEQDGRSVAMPRETLHQPEPLLEGPPKSSPGAGAAPAPAASTPEDLHLAQQRAEDERQRKQAEEEAFQRRVEAAKSQLGVVALGREIAEPAVLRFAVAERPSATAMAGGGASATAPGSVGAAQDQDLVTALEVFAAELTSPIDTYKSTYASARILNGPLAGGFITGRVTSHEEGISIEFDRMRLGKSACPVAIRGLDEKTADTAVEANVDRRYLQRFVWPVLMAAAGGVAQAKAQVAQEVVPIGAGGQQGGGYAITQPAPTRKQAEAAGIAAGAAILQREIDRAAAKPPQFTLATRSVIGVLFNEPVPAACGSTRRNVE